MKKLFIIASILLGSMTTFAQRDLGYRGFVDLGGGIGISSGSEFMVGLSTVHGIQLAPALFLGAGIAANDYAWKEDYGWGDSSNDALVMPIFGDIRVDTGTGRVSPFVEVRGGYDFICGNGIYLSPAVGLHYAKTDNFGFYLTLGLDHQGTKNEFYRKGEKHKSVDYLSLKFGIDF